ncbi:MAG: hypothetical protein AAB425_08810 [Bdellovibrionota bacterium]
MKYEADGEVLSGELNAVCEDFPKQVELGLPLLFDHAAPPGYGV